LVFYADQRGLSGESGFVDFPGDPGALFSSRQFLQDIVCTIDFVGIAFEGGR